VHIWFVRWSEFQNAFADGVLTVPELKAMPSLRMGLASFYHETLHPPEAAQIGRDVIAAYGTLTDGKCFQFEASAYFTTNHEYRLESTRIVF